ncbi:hypothetical protein Glove_637g18 [Diversispora epigaea]|uniref:F-box domain-containing protein n=1 Tax=Diversispora epigaea TaxID=1348612 RepID=A0A397G4T9_9GLOM|nr:hypothetical protein Glove_637g18 [Diversispora epigaea]
MEKFPSLCINSIIENFSDNSHYLHSCLLINRHWCINTIPVLWRDPFRVVSLKSSAYLMNSYLQCCSNEELYEIMGKLENSNVAHFDYPRYLRTLNISRIGVVIQIWLEPQFSNLKFNFVWGEKQKYYLKSFCRFFTSRSSAIHSIAVDLSLSLQENEVSKIPEIFTHPNAKSSISNLREVKCHGMFEKTGFLQFVAKTSNNIHKLSVSVIRTESELKSMVNLINAQKFLLDISIEDCFDNFNMIARALSHKSSLKHIKLIGGRFNCEDLKSLMECYQLKTLMIVECESLRNDSKDEFYNIGKKIQPLSKLYKITLRDTFLPGKLLAFYFQAANSKIQEVELSGLMPSDTHIIIKAITLHCPNIRKLSVTIDEGHYDNLYKLLLSCEKLISILIDSITKEEDGSFDIDRDKEIEANEILPLFGKYIPSSLKLLQIWSNWVFTPESLEKFFINCSAKIEILDLAYCECITDQHLNVFLKYAKGILKNLDIDRARNLSIEALNHARQFMVIEGNGNSYNEVPYESSLWGYHRFRNNNSEDSNPFEEEEEEEEDMELQTN